MKSPSQTTVDGPGFDPQREPDDGQPHIGLKNVKERLKGTVNGRLDVESSPGKGTRVSIFLPKGIR